MTSKDLQALEVFQKADPNVGQHIGFELGAKLVKNYADKTGDATSHFVGRNILEKIFAQPDCVGMKIYKALNQTGEPTYVFVGINSNGRPILDFIAINPEGELAKEEGIVADFIILDPDEKWWGDGGKDNAANGNDR